MRFSGGSPVALDETVLHLDRAADRVYYAAELDNRAVTGALYDAAVVKRKGRVNEIAAERSKARKGAVLISPGEPAVTDDIGHQDCCEFPGLGHWTLGPSGNLTRSSAQSCRKPLKDGVVDSGV